MENSCLSFGIPYKLIGSLKFLQRQEVRDLLAYLNVIVNRADEFSLEELLMYQKEVLVLVQWIKLISMQNNTVFLYLKL